MQPLVFQPARDCIQLVARKPEALTDLGRREPEVELGRGGILLVDEQLLKGLFAVRMAGQNQRQRGHRLFGRNGFKKILVAGPGRDVVGERAKLGGIGGLGHAALAQRTGEQHGKRCPGKAREAHRPARSRLTQALKKTGW